MLIQKMPTEAESTKSKIKRYQKLADQADTKSERDSFINYVEFLELGHQYYPVKRPKSVHAAHRLRNIDLQIEEIADIIGRPVRRLEQIRDQQCGNFTENYASKIIQELEDHNLA